MNFIHDTYGEPYGPTGTGQTVFGFTGQPTDANGLLYLRARYYNPTKGVFPSLDPLEGDSARAISLNRYLYVVGNPVNLTDPSGLFSCTKEDRDIQGACMDLTQALQRGQHLAFLSLKIPAQNPTELLSTQFLKDLEAQAETEFGIKFQVEGLLNNNYTILDDCTLAPEVKKSLGGIKLTLVKSVAALIHIAARIDEAGYAGAANLFKTKIGSQIPLVIELSSSQAKDECSGYSPSNTARLGEAVNTSTIVHEIGHTINNHFRVAAPLVKDGAELHLSTTGQTSYGAATGLTNVLSGLGMTSQAATITALQGVSW